MKKEIKLSLFADDIMLQRSLNISHTKNTRTDNEFSKVAGFKINIQKSVAFLYTNNELSERETKKQSHLQMHYEK